MNTPAFIQIHTADGLTLPGLFYEATSSKKALINLHGNGSSSVFYQGEGQKNFAQIINDAGISFLTFNNRGAHYIKTLRVKKEGEEERKRFGMSYEIIKDCVYDIDAAIEFLKEKGYMEFYLVGFSTGANKICVYDHYKPKNAITNYILAGGGDDTGLYYSTLGKELFSKLLHESKRMLKQGKGEDIICELLPEEIFSHQSFYDTANADGDYNTFPFWEAMGKAKLSTKPLFRYFKDIKKPTLVVYGGMDEFQYGDVSKVLSLLKEQQPKFVYHIIQDADHGFHEKERELAEKIVSWLKK